VHSEIKFDDSEGLCSDSEGENDVEIPLADGERLHSEIPNSRLLVFLNCGHLPHEEYPAAFTSIVSNFVLGGPTAIEMATI